MVIALIAVATGRGVAQTQASAADVTVTVFDTSGGAIEGAVVVLSAGGRELRATSKPDGVARFVAVQPGEWRMTVSREGFAAAQRTLRVGGANATAEVTLQVPGVTEFIQVQGVTPETTYYVNQPTGATKSDVPLHATPAAVRLLSRQLLNDVGAVRLAETLEYVSSISQKNNFGALWDNYAIRGLGGTRDTGDDYLRNGLSGNRGFAGPRDLANVQSIEFIKGSAAALYGSSEAAGILNVVTKKPRFTRAHSIELSAGSFDSYRGAFDTTGPLSDAVAYSLSGAVEDTGSFRDFVETRRLLIAPVVTWRISPRTTITYDAEAGRYEAPLDRGIPLVGGRLDAVPRSLYIGEPATDLARITNHTHQVLLEHRVSDDLRVRGGLSYRHSSFDDMSTQAGLLEPDNQILRRQHRVRFFGTDDFVAQGEVVRKLDTGPLSHEVLAGAEAYRFTLEYRISGVNPTVAQPYAINIFNPAYGQPVPTPNRPMFDTFARDLNGAFYLQDLISVSRVVKLLAGIRVDRYDQRFDNHLTNRTFNQDHWAASPRFGVSYLPTERWTLYANYGRSFRANDGGGNLAGEAFLPERSRSAEAGVKFESANGRVGGSVAGFRLRKRNMVVGDPFNPGFSIAAGEVGSRGVEADVAGQLSRHWRVNLAGSFVEAEVVRDTVLLPGTRISNVSRWNGSALGIWQSDTRRGHPFGFGAGLAYVGDRGGDGLNTFLLPAYTTVRALGFWSLNNAWRLSVEANNLFDEHYYESSQNRNALYPGRPRSVTARLRLAL
jgi:iron complex outermembrane receptor protein